MEISFLNPFIKPFSLEEIQDNELRESILLKVKEIHKPNKSYLKNGYKFSNKTLKQVTPTLLAALPIECMADYISLENKKKVDSNDSEIKNGIREFIFNQDLFYYFTYPIYDYIGLFAYYCMTCDKTNDKDTYERAYKTLSLFFEYRTYCLLGQRDELRKLVSDHKKWCSNIN